MHDALDAELFTYLIKDEVLVKRACCLEATNACEFHGLKMAAQPKFRMDCEALNRLVNGYQVTLGHFNTGIFKIPPVLQRHILFCSQGNDNWQAHARAF